MAQHETAEGDYLFCSDVGHFKLFYAEECVLKSSGLKTLFLNPSSKILCCCDDGLCPSAEYLHCEYEYFTNIALSTQRLQIVLFTSFVA